MVLCILQMTKNSFYVLTLISEIITAVILIYNLGLIETTIIKHNCN